MKCDCEDILQTLMVFLTKRTSISEKYMKGSRSLPILLCYDSKGVSGCAQSRV